MKKQGEEPDKTVFYYENHAEEFCASTVNADMSGLRERFLSHLPKGAHILDAGCGSGRDAKAFLDAGYTVTAMDASERICREAEKLLSVPVLTMKFEELSLENEFDGIWACASLLHVKREELGDVLLRFKRALKKNGILYASFKYGDGERIKDGRYFCDYTENTLRIELEDRGYLILELFATEDVRENRMGEKWVNVIAKAEDKRGKTDESR